MVYRLINPVTGAVVPVPSTYTVNHSNETVDILALDVPPTLWRGTESVMVRIRTSGTDVETSSNVQPRRLGLLASLTSRLP
jgi:hypothetical protein